VRTYMRTLQSEHTIVAAVAPASEDTTGDRLRDENVVHIFFTTVMAELSILCAMRNGASVPLFSLTTLINGLINTSVAAVAAIASKQLFRWGNRLRWRRRSRPHPIRRLLRSFKRASLRLASMAADLLRSIARRLPAPTLVQPRQGARPQAEKGRQRPSLRRPTQATTFTDTAARWTPAFVGTPNPAASKARHVGAFRGRDPRGGGRRTTPSISPPTDKSKAPVQLLNAGRATDGREDGSAPRSKFVPIPRRLRWVRFTTAWVLTFSFYLSCCLVCLTFGVLFQESAFRQLLMAWLVGLAFTWLVVEPAEAFGICVLPGCMQSDRLMWCREKCKDLGIYG
jgi:hypothetical protein